MHIPNNYFFNLHGAYIARISLPTTVFRLCLYLFAFVLGLMLVIYFRFRARRLQQFAAQGSGSERSSLSNEVCCSISGVSMN